MLISVWSSDVCSSDLHPGPSELCCRRDVVIGVVDGEVRLAAVIAPVVDEDRELGPSDLHGRGDVHLDGGGASVDTVGSEPAQRLEGVATVTARDGRSRPQPTTAGDIYLTATVGRSEEHTSELQSLIRISYAVF